MTQNKIASHSNISIINVNEEGKWFDTKCGKKSVKYVYSHIIHRFAPAFFKMFTFISEEWKNYGLNPWARGEASLLSISRETTTSL